MTKQTKRPTSHNEGELAARQRAKEQSARAVLETEWDRHLTSSGKRWADIRYSELDGIIAAGKKAKKGKKAD